MPRLKQKNKVGEVMPMYVTNLMKITGHVPVGPGQWIDDLGNVWLSEEPVWYFDLCYVSSGRKYYGGETAMESVQARTKVEAKRKIKVLWGVTRFE